MRWRNAAGVSALVTLAMLGLPSTIVAVIVTAALAFIWVVSLD